MTLNFRADMSRQTVQTQIRLLLEEQSGQGLHRLLFHVHHFLPKSLRFDIFVRILGSLQQKNFGVRKFRDFTVLSGATSLTPS